MRYSNLLKPYLPKSLLGRSLLIIVTPLILLQVVATVVFFENHWSRVGQRLAQGVAGDIAQVISQMPDYARAGAGRHLFAAAERNLHIRFNYLPGEVMALPGEGGQDIRLEDRLMEKMLRSAMYDFVAKPFTLDLNSINKTVIIHVQLAEGVLEARVPRSRLFSSTTYVFVIWMAGISLLLFGVAMVFMKNQVRPISRLAVAADDFGKGRDTPGFKPEGASEVRRAAQAFIEMRDRLQRQIEQRTGMLSGVSHDLRTPLTRMKLQLEMMGGIDGSAELKSDIADMEHMLEEYLAFARGESGEKPQHSSIAAMLGDIVAGVRRKNAGIDLHCEGSLDARVRAGSLKRALTNLVENAVRYGGNVAVRAGRRDDNIEILIDDGGPGIPEEKREDVFRPFYRLDGSRNPGTGGVGLGLTISRDAVRAHGGDIQLLDAPGGGLRARVIIPV